jgi:hypothetical protein
MTFLTFLLGCWLGCLSGFFLAYALKGRVKSEKVAADSGRMPADPPNSVFIR